MSLRKTTVRTLELVEHQPLHLEPDALAHADAELIWHNYASQVAIEFPSLKTGGRWQLTSLGWVGVLPVTSTLTLVLQPKVPLATIWAMLAYAFDLVQIECANELVDVATLPDLYDRLAFVLAQRILHRNRKGLYQQYVPQSARVAAVRGRLAPVETLRTPWRPAPFCHFEEQTTDAEDNQILLWTLDRLLHSGVCGAATEHLVRRAHSRLLGAVSLRPLNAAVCLNRSYTRLNADYQPLHALCHLFLAQMTPAPIHGQTAMQPFYLPMADLFERFVAGWMADHMAEEWRLDAQERYRFGRHSEVTFAIDLVIRQRATGAVRWVLDTKYKTLSRPTSDEIAQVLAYAEAAGAPEAVLIYPVRMAHPLDVRIGRVRVRSLTFALNGDLAQSGASLLEALSIRSKKEKCK
jgi:5-methylcytosine-specific restriction enzyme subunit McrC